MGEPAAIHGADKTLPVRELAPVTPGHQPLADVNHDTIAAAKACANSGLPEAQRAVDSKIGSCQIINDGDGTSHSVFRDGKGSLMQLTASDSQGPALQFTRIGNGDQFSVSDRSGASQPNVSDLNVSQDGKSFSFTGPRGEHVTSNEHGNTIVTPEGRTIIHGAAGITEYPSDKERQQGFSTTSHLADGTVQVLGEGKQQLTVNADGTGKITFSDGFEKQINPPYTAADMKMFQQATIARLTELPDHHLKVEMKQRGDAGSAQ